ncbi:phage portal protein [Methylobacterium sp.]|uniref:phage portal protein n=1 Tax=Methylobacterium sp. TaxID=409 RepID=UPI003B024E8F
MSYGNVKVTYASGGGLAPLAIDLSGDGLGGRTDATPYTAAGGTGRRSRSWRVGSYGPNIAITYSLDELRNKSRDQVRKNPYAGAAKDKLVSNLVGVGIVPRSVAARATEGLDEDEAKRIKAEDSAFRAELQRLWLAWTDEADATGTLDFYGLQALAAAGMVEGGESFTRLRTRLLTDGMIVPLQLQVMEGDHCPHLKTGAAPSPNERTETIRQGIQFNAIGRRTGYWLHREHPGDGIVSSGFGEPVFVPAVDICHLFRPSRPGQDRGEPWLARALSTLYDLDAYLDAELQRKKNAALFLGFVKRVGEDDGGAGIIGSSAGSGPIGSDPADGEGIGDIEMDPGTLQVLADGEDVTFSSPPDVGPNFDMFVREAKRRVAAAAGLLYEILSTDYGQLNDRTLRAALNDFRRAVETWQHHLIVFQFCRPVWARWIDLAILSGALKPPQGMTRQQAGAVKWITPNWPYIHPVQDVEGKSLEIQSGFASRTQKVAEGGYDAEEIDRENAADNERADGLGLTYTSDGRQKVKPVAAAEPDDGPDDPAPPPNQEPA